MEGSMGLDGVELLMEVEDEFGITIDDDAPPAEGDVTVGDLYRHILEKLRAKGEVLGPDASAKCLSSAAFYVFRRGLCDEFGLDRQRVRPSTRMEDLVPKADRRRRWRALSMRLGLDLPKLERAPAMLTAIRCSTVAVFAAGFAFLYAGWIPPMAVWALTGGSIGFAVIALALTGPLAIHFPRATQTVRGMVLRVLATNLKKIAGAPPPQAAKRRLHPDEVWEMLRSIVVEQLDIPPEEVTKKARFYKDLGVG
jgi:acyl carrier protein